MTRPTVSILTLAEEAVREPDGRLTVRRIVDGFATNQAPMAVPRCVLIARLAWVEGAPTRPMAARLLFIDPTGAELGTWSITMDPPRRKPGEGTAGVEVTMPIGAGPMTLGLPGPGVYRFRLEIDGETVGEAFLDARLSPTVSDRIQ